MIDNNSHNSRLGFKDGKNYGVLVVLVVCALLTVGVFYVAKLNLSKGGHSGARQASETQDDGSAAPKVVVPEFTYKVKSVTAEQIVLEGKNGDFTLPNDSASVKAYAGPSRESPALPLEDLKVGDVLTMEIVAGRSATLFVSR